MGAEIGLFRAKEREEAKDAEGAAVERGVRRCPGARLGTSAEPAA